MTKKQAAKLTTILTKIAKLSTEVTNATERSYIDSAAVNLRAAMAPSLGEK